MSTERRPHWTEDAERVSDGRLAQHPVWGLVGEDDGGYLVLPAWRNLTPELGIKPWTRPAVFGDRTPDTPPRTDER